MSPPISISVLDGDLYTFKIEDGRVSTKYITVYSTKKSSCTCTAFKTGLSKTCEHIRILNFYKVGDASKEKYLNRSAEFKQTSSWDDHSPVYIKRGLTHRGTLHNYFPQTSVFGLVAFLLSNSESEQMKRTSEILNHKTLLNELVELHKTQKSIMLSSPGVKEVKASMKVVAEPVVKKDPPLWETIEAPDDFYVPKPVWQQLVYSALKGKNVLLVGPSGSGKSELVYALASKCGAELEAFNFGAMSEPRSSLIGLSQYEPSKGTWFQPSRFVKAVTSDKFTIILLDELTRADRAGFNIILPLLDRQGYLALDESESGQVVRKGANVSFMSTANVGMEYTGTDALDKALKDRNGCVIEMDFPPADAEVKILQKRSKIEARDAELLVRIATDQRRRSKAGEFMESISTRMLIAAAEQVGEGFPIKNAVEFCISNHFSKEGEDASDRSNIGKIIQKILG